MAVFWGYGWIPPIYIYMYIYIYIYTNQAWPSHLFDSPTGLVVFRTLHLNHAMWHIGPGLEGEQKPLHMGNAWAYVQLSLRLESNLSVLFFWMADHIHLSWKDWIPHDVVAFCVGISASQMMMLEEARVEQQMNWLTMCNHVVRGG